MQNTISIITLVTFLIVLDSAIITVGPHFGGQRGGLRDRLRRIPSGPTISQGGLSALTLLIRGPLCAKAGAERIGQHLLTSALAKAQCTTEAK